VLIDFLAVGHDSTRRRRLDSLVPLHTRLTEHRPQHRVHVPAARERSIAALINERLPRRGPGPGRPGDVAHERKFVPHLAAASRAVRASRIAERQRSEAFRGDRTARGTSRWAGVPRHDEHVRLDHMGVRLRERCEGGRPPGGGETVQEYTRRRFRLTKSAARSGISLFVSDSPDAPSPVVTARRRGDERQR